MTLEVSNVAGIPQDLEAEQAVLGSLIYRNDLLHEVAALLTPLSFYAVAHQHIFQAMLELEEEDQPIDEILIGDKLITNEKLEASGGRPYLAELIDFVPSSGNVVYYAKIVQEHALLRELISTSTEIAKKSRNPNQNIGELLAEAESKITELSTRSNDKSYSHIKNVLKSSFEQLERNSANDSDITGLPTGFTDLDMLTSGLQNSDLIILAARPSMGKTAFALNVAKYVATKGGGDNTGVKGAVMVFSLEMAKEQLATRLLTSEAKIDATKLRTGNLDPEDWDKLTMATDVLSGTNLYINDTPALSPFQISTICKQLQKESEEGVSMIIVDYLQLMRGNRPNMPREQEIAEISRSLKGLAKELNVPVMALSQLNRSLESRSDKRPMMSDLRESGSIEQDADIIMFIYRDEVYNKEDSPDKGKAELIIGKHRNGATGMVPLAFIGKYTNFGNLAREAQSYEDQ